MKKRYIIFYILIIVWGLLIVKALMPTSKLVVAYYEKYTVQSGDTLDSIAKQYPHNNRLGEFVYIIKDNNNTTALIHPGQELLIPIIEQR